MAVLVYSAVSIGLKIVPVVIEAALGHGFSGLQIIGLPNDFVRDARERIRASLESLGLPLPARRLVLSIRPSEALKHFKGGLEHLDLPCAVALTAALAEQSSQPKIKTLCVTKIHKALSQRECFFAGQLTLAGEVLPLENTLPFELIALNTNNLGRSFFCCSEPSVGPSSEMRNWHKVTSLNQCLNDVAQKSTANSVASATQQNVHFEDEGWVEQSSDEQHSFELLKGTLEQFSSTPALGLAIFLSAAGRHHLLLSGSPGCGKTYALRALQNLLPPMGNKEKMDIALIHNRNAIEVNRRPFRTPHHSASGAALLGGSLLQPGEVSLAHHGVLFLDELAEFHRPTLEALREPLDEQRISLSRARGRVELPAQFLLLAATNPCPCGYFYSISKACRCQSSAPIKYQQKMSGPLLERFSILLLIDALTPTSNSAVFPHTRTLIEFADRWFHSFQKNPIHWTKKLRSAQLHFWSRSKAETNAIEQNAVESLSDGQMWSIRKKTQLTRLCKTLNYLFGDDDHCKISLPEALQLAIELRSFEQSMHESVHLLTPQQQNLQLKNST